MLKEAIEKIISLVPPATYEISGETFSSKELCRVEPRKADRPKSIGFTSLDGIVQSLKLEIERVTTPVFICVEHHNKVVVYTTYRNDDMSRDFLYSASPESLDRLPEWMSHDDAMIALRSRFVETEDTKYIIDLLSSISDDESVKTVDNGLTQTVNVKQGISLKQTTVIKPRVSLRPFRTFLEVEQPESEFLLRMKPGNSEKGTKAQIGLFEADGGAWKLDAKRNIAEHLRHKLFELVECGKVIITE